MTLIIWDGKSLVADRRVTVRERRSETLESEQATKIIPMNSRVSCGIKGAPAGRPVRWLPPRRVAMFFFTSFDVFFYMTFL